MAYHMSLPSASPFQYQLAKQTCAPADLWPDFKSWTTEIPKTPKPKETQQDAPQSALDRAFIAANEALKGGAIQQRQAGWTSTKSLLPDHETLLPDPSAIDVSLKRKAEAAGIHDEVQDVKKFKIEFVDFDTQMQKKKPGRPSKGLQRSKKAMKGFRTNRPVALELTRWDIWCNILEYSPLSQLFRMRDVFRHYLLTWPTIWKTARRNTYGSDHPDPPPGMSERQYADLLVGFGCQGKGCNDTRTRKVYWAFQRRWCVTCMKKNVAMNAGCHLFFRKYPDVPQCVPRAAFDQYGHYTCALGVGDNDKYTCTLSYGHNIRPPWLKQGYQDKIGYLRADLARMSQEFEEFDKRVSPDEAEFSDTRKVWIDGWKKANHKLVESLQSIEDWMETYKLNVRKEAETRREEKQAFNQAVSATLEQPDIPVNPGILETTDDFIYTQMFTATTLMRSQSEVSSERAEMQPQAHEPNPEDLSGNCAQTKQDGTTACRAKAYTEFADARNDSPTPETLFIIALAQGVVDDMGDIVADGEFVRVALMRTYKRFQEEWAVCRPGEPSRLLMDDARLVYREVIEPRLDVRIKRSSFRRTEATGSVMCPGCKKGRGVVKLYSFPDLMTHIYERHALDDNDDFKDFIVDRAELPCHVRFPWCSIEWPRNLPILAVGQDTKGRWDLHREGEEQPQLPYCEPGAFNGRVVAAPTGLPDDQFVPNVLFAASQLEASSLGDEFQTQIALEYAVQKFEPTRHTRPGFDLLEELQLALMRNGIKGLFEGFRCQKCCEAVVHEGRVGYLARSVKPFGELSEHFRKVHSKEGDWTRNMLDLPSAQDLLAELQLPRNTSSLGVFDELFPLQGESTLDPQLRQLTAVIG